MTRYNDTVRKHRRLAILRFLEELPSGTSNESVLTDVVGDIGVRSTRSQIITELIWLKQNGFVDFDEAGDFLVVTVTQQGCEIATGQATHPEIQRPRRKG